MQRYEHEMKRFGEYRQGLDREGIYEDVFVFYSCITKS